MAKFTNEQLLQQFENYLENALESRDDPVKKLDLFSFYSEIIALKNEVKIESRLIKQGLDDFKETAAVIEQVKTGLDSRSREKDRELKVTAERSVLRPVLLGLIDLYDRIHASLHAVSVKRPTGLLFRLRLCRSHDGEVIRSMREGQKMILERILALLADCGVHPIEAPGCRFNPQTMRAVGTDVVSEIEEGMVSVELRAGFTWNDEVLRPAEVRVNRRMGTTD